MKNSIMLSTQFSPQFTTSSKINNYTTDTFDLSTKEVKVIGTTKETWLFIDNANKPQSTSDKTLEISFDDQNSFDSYTDSTTIVPQPINSIMYKPTEATSQSPKVPKTQKKSFTKTHESTTKHIQSDTVVTSKAEIREITTQPIPNSVPVSAIPTFIQTNIIQYDVTTRNTVNYILSKSHKFHNLYVQSSVINLLVTSMQDSTISESKTREILTSHEITQKNINIPSLKSFGAGSSKNELSATYKMSENNQSALKNPETRVEFIDIEVSTLNDLTTTKESIKAKQFSEVTTVEISRNIFTSELTSKKHSTDTWSKTIVNADNTSQIQTTSKTNNLYETSVIKHYYSTISTKSIHETTNQEDVSFFTTTQHFLSTAKIASSNVENFASQENSHVSDNNFNKQDDHLGQDSFTSSTSTMFHSTLINSIIVYPGNADTFEQTTYMATTVLVTSQNSVELDVYYSPTILSTSGTTNEIPGSIESHFTEVFRLGTSVDAGMSGDSSIARSDTTDNSKSIGYEGLPMSTDVGNKTFPNSAGNDDTNNINIIDSENPEYSTGPEVHSRVETPFANLDANLTIALGTSYIDVVESEKSITVTPTVITPDMSFGQESDTIEKIETDHSTLPSTSSELNTSTDPEATIHKPTTQRWRWWRKPTTAYPEYKRAASEFV